MTHSENRRKRWKRLELTLISKTILAWLVSTVIFLFFIGTTGWAEWLTFTAAAFGFVGYKEWKGNENVATPTYPDGGP